jgi:hypothetical protein
MKTTVLLVLFLSTAAGLRVLGSEDKPSFDLTTLRGESFQHCRIIKATPEGITIAHDNGVSKISFENLNDEWKKLFHYSSEKASAFQKEEAARLASAEEKRLQARKEHEKSEAQRRGEASAVEQRRLQQLEEAIAFQQVGTAAAAAASQPGLLIPLAGDPTFYLVAGATTSRTSMVGRAGSTVQSFTEVAIPATTPIGQVYTPGATRSQRYIINQGAVFTTGDGTLYDISPGYVSPGYFTPGYYNPPVILCPPVTTRPGSPASPVPHATPPGATIRVGPGVIRVGR